MAHILLFKMVVTGVDDLYDDGECIMKRLWKTHCEGIVEPLGFLIGWSGLCTFLLNKYAGYILGTIS